MLKRALRVVEANVAAIASAVNSLHQVALGESRKVTVQNEGEATESDFIAKVIKPAMSGQGNRIPVSVLPVDGSFPTATGRLEKRNISDRIPQWETDICTQCGKCVFVCPHSVIRSKIFSEEEAEKLPESFKQVPLKTKAYGAGWHISYQVAAEDCTGCELCVEVCPIRDKTNPDRKAINMIDKAPVLEQERENWELYQQISEPNHQALKLGTIPGSQLCDPLFEFSGACSGCGETPYINLVSRLFGDRMLIGNATGCSSIYGGNLPTTPYSTNAEGRGPAWNNSLFEDNAEFTLGMRLAVDQLRQWAEQLCRAFEKELGSELVEEIIACRASDEASVWEQRQRVEQLRAKLKDNQHADAVHLKRIADYLVHRSIWAIGGDGWAYDIGFGGLDQVLASGENVNLLVLDTEVYSNTGGQTSKATPLGAIAKFSAGGRPRRKKDLAAHAMAYEDVYVAQIAFGAKDTHTLKALMEAEQYPGTSLIIAYSPCIAHGVDMKYNLRQQDMAVNSGHWPLLRYDPRKAEQGQNPLKLDYKKPTIPYRDYVQTEARFSVLWRTHPEQAEAFVREAQKQVHHRYHHLKSLAEIPEEPKEAEQQKEGES